MKTETLQALIRHIESECKAIDREARFDAMLDECYSVDSVGGPFQYMSPSRVLREMDPTAHRCGVNDYADGEEWVEVGDQTYDQGEAEDARESFVEEMESELSSLETDFDTMEEEDDADPAQLATIQKEIDELRAEIAEVEKYSF